MRCARLRSLGMGVVVAASLLPSTTRAATPTLIIKLSISGGYRYTGTLATSAPLRSRHHPTSGNICSTLPVDIGQPLEYIVAYNRNVFVDGILSSDALFLGVKNFKPAETLATKAPDIEVDVAVRGRFMYHFASGATANPAFRVTVRLAADGRSGSFVASHLLASVPTTRSRNLLTGHYRAGPPVNVRGSWKCSTLQTS